MDVYLGMPSREEWIAAQERIKELSAELEAARGTNLESAVARKRIARIINPQAFDENFPMRGRMHEQKYALERADAILSAGPVTVPEDSGKTCAIGHDGFVGTVIGSYVTREGKQGVVLQQIGTRVVHVYGRKWIAEPQPGAPQ